MPAVWTERGRQTMRLIDADALKTTASIQRANFNTLGSIRQWIDEAPTIEAVPRWIPCEERLPEPNVAVLGYAPKFNNIFAVYYDSICGWMIWSPVYDEPFPNSQGDIVAWMPLPEPWKEDEDGD